MSEWSFVIAAYGLTWIVLAGYTLYLRARVRRAETALRWTRSGDGEGR